jgi:hypothetical protein
LSHSMLKVVLSLSNLQNKKRINDFVYIKKIWLPDIRALLFNKYIIPFYGRPMMNLLKLFQLWPRISRNTVFDRNLNFRGFSGKAEFDQISIVTCVKVLSLSCHPYGELLKGQCQQIFDLCFFFMKQYPLCPWFTG